MTNPSNIIKSSKVAIIGGGPAGLMAAETLSLAGINVVLYDAMPTVGRKFLMAGKGGMNITHSEALTPFISRYGTRQTQIAPLLNAMSPQALREWIHGLGIETFVGSSGRVFPTDMKAAPLLRAWLHRLRETGVNFHMRHRWIGWDNQKLKFNTPSGECTYEADAVVFALGGGSWARLGSDGAWVNLLSDHGVSVSPLKPANCGFNMHWSEHFTSRFAGSPLKTVAISMTDEHAQTQRKQGECMVTASGIEGGLIYALSANIRDTIDSYGEATIHLDLLPDRSLEQVLADVTHPRGSRSLSSHLQSRLSIKGIKAALLRELMSAQDYTNPIKLGNAIKSLPLKLTSTRPIDEAISSAGGVNFECLNEQLMIKALPGVFCAGEMLDWEAPTGGYLLTACFASGRSAGLGVIDWLKAKH
ncbi:MAG: TIGR03862 family flavoprotein [Methylotenera sp.]|uniref:TIGR03862 family flavoprotein n=1 Tax=Methylotenera sp. TaxID=2051956 RepID=UPI00272189C5|nr:TIGR03862 family flavoprotein [Methylotenera sp.]MDO9149815.1 TIGR03862 family flavoprotein [Methylotenera sp.]